MFRNKTIVFVLSAVACMATFAYCQEGVENRQLSTVSGALANIDFVGSTIIVKTDSEQMAFSVPDDAMITRGTEKIGLVDLEENDPVTIRYYSSSSGQYAVASIADNNVDE